VGEQYGIDKEELDANRRMSLSGEVLGEGFAECSSSTKESGLNGGNREVENRRDFFVGKILMAP